MHTYSESSALPQADFIDFDAVVIDKDFDQFSFDALDISVEKEQGYEF